jgi:hypothetical protein
MDITIPHSVTYDFAGRATVDEVSKSLVAQEKLIREALAVLEEVFPKLSLEGLRIEFSEASQSSPYRNTLLAYFAGVYSPEIGEEMPDILNTLFGVNVPDSYDGIVSLIVLLIAIWGIDKVREKLFPGKKEKELEAEKQRLLTEASNKAYVTEDQLEEALEKTLAKHKRSIMKASADFLEPAKRHNATAVKVDGAEISQKAIAAMPSDIDLADYEPPSEVEELLNVTVKFRAHDLDKNKAWAATIEDVSPLRRPLHLAPDVRPDQLFDKKEVKGDVMVTSILDQDGEYTPSLYYLLKVHDD